MMKLRDRIQNWVGGMPLWTKSRRMGGKKQIQREPCEQKNKAKQNQRHESEPSQSMFEVYVQGPQRTEF